MISERKPGDQDPEFGVDGVIAVGLDKRIGGYIRHLKEGYLIVGTYNTDQSADSIDSPSRAIIGASPSGFDYSAGLTNRVVTVRLDKNGELVPSYGNGGYAFIEPFKNHVRLTGWSMLPDESVLVSLGIFDVDGGAFDSIAIVKIGADGKQDTSFGNSGIYRPVLAEEHSIAWSMASQDDGGILISAVTVKDVYNSTSVLMRIDSQGRPDLSFGMNGFVYSSLGAEEGFSRIKLDSQQRIYVAGNVKDQMALSRFCNDGSVDKSFGDAGKFLYGDGNPGAFVANLAIRASTIFVVGSLGGIGGQAAVYTALNMEGWPDQGFNGGVPLRVELGSSNSGRYVIPLESGLTLGIGTSFGVTGALTLSRITANGTLDTTFGEEGSVLTNVLGYLTAYFAEETEDAEGIGSKLLIGGLLLNPRPGEKTSFWISRYLI